MIVGDGIRSYTSERPDPEIPKPSMARIAAKAANPAIPTKLEGFHSCIYASLFCADILATARWSESVIDDEDCHLRKALLAGQDRYGSERHGVGFASNHEVSIDNHKRHNILAL